MRFLSVSFVALSVCFSHVNAGSLRDAMLGQETSGAFGSVSPTFKIQTPEEQLQQLEDQVLAQPFASVPDYTVFQNGNGRFISKAQYGNEAHEAYARLQALKSGENIFKPNTDLYDRAMTLAQTLEEQERSKPNPDRMMVNRAYRLAYMMAGDEAQREATKGVAVRDTFMRLRNDEKAQTLLALARKVNEARLMVAKGQATGSPITPELAQGIDGTLRDQAKGIWNLPILDSRGKFDRILGNQAFLQTRAIDSLLEDKYPGIKFSGSVEPNRELSREAVQGFMNDVWKGLRYQMREDMEGRGMQELGNGAWGRIERGQR